MRTDIAKSRVIQRLEYGGLAMAIPRPDLQEKASHVFWLRRMLMEGDHSWKRMLDHWLVEANRPSIDLHFKLGRQDWKKTGAKGVVSTFSQQRHRCV